MSKNPHLGGDAIAFLNSIIPDTPENRVMQQQEAMRIELTQVLIDARKASGKSHAEIAEILGKKPSEVEKAENCNYPHTWDEFAAYLYALEAEFELTVTLPNGQKIALDTSKLKQIAGSHIPHPNCHKGVFTVYFLGNESKMILYSLLWSYYLHTFNEIYILNKNQ